jgi:hypothetical protein
VVLKWDMKHEEPASITPGFCWEENAKHDVSGKSLQWKCRYRMQGTVFTQESALPY